MSGNIPKWLTGLALEIYKIIQKHNALDWFREMVDKWASKHEGDVKNRLEWEERKGQYFQQLSSGDPRLLDKGAGPPDQGWEWETFVVHDVTTQTADSGEHAIVSGWVPPELSISAEPEISHPLPLNREHQLTIEEKYTVLAAVYDVGRKGTEEIPPWEWPKSWGEEGAFPNAKRCIFFEGVCRSVSELNPDDEGWLRTFLDDVTKDIERQAGHNVVGRSKDVIPDATRVERWIRKAKNHPVMSILIVLGIVVGAIGFIATSLDAIFDFYGNYVSNDAGQQTRPQDFMGSPIVSAAASVEINVRSEEQINSHNMNRGISLAFAKEREPVLTMSSQDSYTRQMGDDVVCYSGHLGMSLSDKAFNQPLSILKQTQYVQILVEAMPRNSEILSGTITCAFNDSIPVKVVVPYQKMQGNVVVVRDIDFAELLKTK